MCPDERCKSSSNTVRLDWNQGPKIPILLRKVDRKHVMDNEVCPFGNSLEFVKKHQDVGRKSIRLILDRNWPALRSIAIIWWPESFLMSSCKFRSGCLRHLRQSCSHRPWPSFINSASAPSVCLCIKYFKKESIKSNEISVDLRQLSGSRFFRE